MYFFAKVLLFGDMTIVLFGPFFRVRLFIP